MLSPGQAVTLTIEKPAAGGRMIARLDGQVVLVAGAIPGEVVSARVERVGKGVVYAQTMSAGDPSVDRRPPFTDPLCGGCLYAHIAYPRQLVLKGQIIADAFARIGRIPLAGEPRVTASPGEGYRMRARLHVLGPDLRSGFLREGTHDLCDARATRQLLPSAYDAIDRIVDVLRVAGVVAVQGMEISENIDASQRVVHLQTSALRSFAGLQEIEGITGVTIGRPIRAEEGAAGFSSRAWGATVTPPSIVASGDPYVTDTVSINDRPVTLRRHVLAFFQGNRYLVQDLITHVINAIAPGSSVVDLYAGVGAFAIAAAVAREARVTAVEGDPVAAADLNDNAAAAGGGIEAVHQDVETFTARSRLNPDVLIVDPPRTGMSKAALEGALHLRARHLIYVSCDVATLARDSRKILDAGYTLQRIDAFDLFPHTPHVETVVRFERGGT